VDELDLEHREVCPDGRCVGVIGEDDRCGVCGTARDGGPAVPEDAPPAVAVSVPSADEAEAIAEEIDARVLCPDGRCVGIIGPNGRCGTCGRPPLEENSA
jgi:hypothetical protein